MKRSATWIYSLLLFITVSCTKRSPNQLLIGNWKMVDTVEQQPLGPTRINGGGICYNFINDSLVDRKRRYFENIQPTTKYKIVNDSLKFFDSTDSVWEKGSLLKNVTSNSLILVNTEGRELIFARHTYENNDTPNIDAIVLCRSGGFGLATRPIINLLIDSDGEVTFYGERYTDKIGLFEGRIPKDRFERIKSEFNKAEIQKLKQDYSAEWTDAETISTTFVFRNEFVNSIRDYGGAGPDELEWAYPSLKYLFQDLELKKLDSTIVPIHPDFHYLRFEKGKKICALTQSESFLLWNYLRRGTLVQTKANIKYDLKLFRRYTWFPLFDESEDPYREKAFEKIRRITTDGQYYTFDIGGQKPITIDIGFNFFDLNQKFFSFREKGEYDYP